MSLLLSPRTRNEAAPRVAPPSPPASAGQGRPGVVCCPGSYCNTMVFCTVPPLTLSYFTEMLPVPLTKY